MSDLVDDAEPLPLPRLQAPQRRLSQRLLGDVVARVSGRSPDRSYICRWERGVCAPDRYWRRHLAIVLKVDMSVLEAALAAWRYRRAISGLAGDTAADAEKGGGVGCAVGAGDQCCRWPASMRRDRCEAFDVSANAPKHPEPSVPGGGHEQA